MQQVIRGALKRRARSPARRGRTRVRGPRYRAGQLAGALRPTGTTVDVAGGWFDAGDYLKFSGTATFTDLVLLFTLREYGTRLPSAAALTNEARFGTDWLLKTWDPQRRVLYEQVGSATGTAARSSATMTSGACRSATTATGRRSLRFISHRPVFAANRPGRPSVQTSPGARRRRSRCARRSSGVSDPAYAHRCLVAGQTLYIAAAKSWHGRLAGSVPASYYPESEWRDDMELAAIELYLATVKMMHA